MNRPATHGGYTLYQASYHLDPGGPSTSVLSVSWDPGQPVVFAGYVLMLAGMVWVLALRVIDRRKGRPSDGGGQVLAGEP
jgi:cytochrome c biogenesis protein ResB